MQAGMMHKYTNDRLCVFYTCVSINSVIKWTSKGVVTMASKYGNPRGQAATDAKRKYNSKNYDRIYPYVKKGKKSVYQRAAKASGFDSINDMIESLMDERAVAVLGLSPEQFAAEVQAAADAEQEKA